MGLYDLPAFIDFILKKLGVSKIAAYIGHSEGTTQMFIGSSMNSSYFKDKVDLFVALAPIVRLDHTKNSMMKFASEINSELS